MKMNKILAAGVAATLAVTSLSAVVSAEKREFDMHITTGSFTYKAYAEGNQDVNVGKMFEYVKDDTIVDKPTYKLYNLVENIVADTNMDGAVDYQDFDAFIPLKITASTGVADLVFDTIGDVTLTITGRGLDNGNLVNIAQEVKLVRLARLDNDFGGAGYGIYALPIYFTDAPGAGFMPEKFVAVDRITVNASGAKDLVIDNLGESDYKYIDENAKNADGSLVKYWPGFYLVDNKVTTDGTDTWTHIDNGKDGADFVDYLTDYYRATGTFGAGVTGQAPADATTLTISLYDGFTANNTVANGIEATTDTFVRTLSNAAADTYDAWGGWKGLALANTAKVTGAALHDAKSKNAATNTAAQSGAQMGDALIAEIRSLFANSIKIRWKLDAGSGVTTDTPAWLPRTDINGDGKLIRNEIWELSTTGDYRSSTLTNTSAGNYAGVDSNTQSYTGGTPVADAFINVNKRDDRGTGPKGFAGLASQIADFFNKEDNGTITFHFTADAGTSSTKWLNGGIPSTEVGLKTVIDGSTASDFALFVNYGSTTGSLQAGTKLDKESGAVVFDITEILNQLNTYTIGTVQDVYYGCTKYANELKNKSGVTIDRGFWVDKVTLAYEESSAVDSNTDEEPEDPTEAEPEDKDEEPAEVDEPTDLDEEPGDEEPTDLDEEPTDLDEEPTDLDDEPAPVDDEPAPVDDEPAPADETPVDNDSQATIDEPADTTPAVDNGTTTPAVVDGADENPGTGVALAVVPAMLAAAAMVISKKRK